MDGPLMKTASSILQRAVKLDNEKRFTESLVCYQEGIQVLMALSKTVQNEERIKLRPKIEDYMKRAEKVKTHIEDLKEKGSYREQFQVTEDARGFSYKSVMSRFLDEDVTNIEVDDPYIRSPHQCDNFVRFLELCLSRCDKLKTIKLITGKDNDKAFEEQFRRLKTIQNSLAIVPGKLVELNIEFSDSLHDREIRLDNGWVIKVGRGLDYFKQMDRFNVGFSDYDLRPCRATTIDIFHKKDLQRIK